MVKMENLHLPPIKDVSTSRFNLNVQNIVKNIFPKNSVLSSQQARKGEPESVKNIPVNSEDSSGVHDSEGHSLQSTRVLKTEVEVDRMEKRLVLKKQEFKDRMRALEGSRAHLRLRQQEKSDLKLKAMEQQTLIKQLERVQNKLQMELEELTQQLEHVEVRKTHLKNKVSKYKIYEDYLCKVSDLLPENFLEHGVDSLVKLVIRRHETMSIAYIDLMTRLETLIEKLQRKKHAVETLRREHEAYRLMSEMTLSELRTELHRIKESNKGQEMKLLMLQGQSRDRTEEMERLLTAVSNLGEQCHMKRFGPLKDLDPLTKLDMIKAVP
ncbi:coiled-coil domain-containing protein 18-like isoform X2 [Scleropages formosus]|uniref:coiled-coil domain-containing protein 18-like isoform X2 n=1 Tax=Scleropages formosus TaxID=113540 RepID=UPI0008780542|nr:coiled-coil domain-containing protein 18-like isoform X2 [Scleropages formosus]